MKIYLTAYSQPNSGVSGSDTDSMRNGTSTFIDTLVEYAARVCYKSTANMGKSELFIQRKLVQSGHHDVIEHGWVVLGFCNLNFTDFCQVLWWKHIVPYLEYFTPHGCHNEVLIGGNVRAWRMLIESRVLGELIADEIAALVSRAAPMCMADIYKQDKPWSDRALKTTVASERVGQATVSLLGATWLPDTCPDNLMHATFLFEGISRACTHQLVRHRIGSFSQESQRYVDLEKGDWKIITPPEAQGRNTPIYDINGEPEYYASEIFGDTWRYIKNAYLRTRSAGLRKEDARFLLPNAVETRIVTSMPLHGWRHFFGLRCAKDAQWEIRSIATASLKLLDKVYPHRFDAEMERYLNVKRQEPAIIPTGLTGKSTEDTETVSNEQYFPEAGPQIDGVNTNLRQMGHGSLEETLVPDL